MGVSYIADAVIYVTAESPSVGEKKNIYMVTIFKKGYCGATQPWYGIP